MTLAVSMLPHSGFNTFGPVCSGQIPHISAQHILMHRAAVMQMYAGIDNVLGKTVVTAG